MDYLKSKLDRTASLAEAAAAAERPPGSGPTVKDNFSKDTPLCCFTLPVKCMRVCPLYGYRDFRRSLHEREASTSMDMLYDDDAGCSRALSSSSFTVLAEK